MDSRFASAGWTAIRVVFGASLALFHGYAKVFQGGAARLTQTVAELGFPAPKLFAWCASLAEFAGGLLVAVGLLTRPAAAAAAFTMLVALHRHRVDPWGRSELALLYLTVMVAVALLGPGRFALDRVLGLRSPIQARRG